MLNKDNGRLGTGFPQTANNHPTYGNYTTRPCPIKLKGRTIGQVDGYGVLKKTINFSAHKYHKLDAIAFDISTLEDARQAGAIWAEVHDNETGRAYHTTLAQVHALGTFLNFVSPQLALPLKYWSRGPVSASTATQLTLLEVAL